MTGAPSFRLQAAYDEYRQYTWHTNRDTYDKIVFDDLRNNATLAAMLAYLASEANQLSGELWSVGGGSVSRVFTGLCEGYFKHPDRDGPLTIEDVAEHVDDVRIEDGYIVPVSSRDEFAKLGPMLYS